MVSAEISRRLKAAFPRAFINCNLEFIADPKVNSYFILEDCTDEEDVIAKCLEWQSRDAYSSLHYDSDNKNHQCHLYHLKGINQFCGTSFTEDDIDLIYTYLGNKCNHQKTLAFIRSGYDMRVLLPQEFEVGDVCEYPYGHPTNKSQAVVKIVKILPDPRGVAEIKVVEVINDDTGNNYLTHLHRTGKTMNVSLRYCHKRN